MAKTSSECCDPDTPADPKDWNPKKERRRGMGKVQLFEIKNPIPAEVEDSQELKKFFLDYDLVPYAGSTLRSGHTLLMWYLALAKMSSTHGTCISKLGKYAFGGRAIFVAAEDPEYQLSQEQKQVTPQQAQRYFETLKETVTFSGGVRDFHRWVGASVKASGNAWAELVVANTLGQIHCNVNYHKPMRCIFRNTKPGERKEVWVSPIWTDQYLKDNPPRLIPMYPNFVKAKDGTLRTMFQLKAGDNDWYGRPDTEMSDLAKANEARQALYLLKQAGANFMGQLILEVESPQLDAAINDEDSRGNGFQDFMDEFEQNYTVKSDDPSTVLISARPFGARPMFALQIKPNTNENWYKVIGDLDSGTIMRSHNCTKRFIGFDVDNGLSGADAFFTDYIINMEPVINEHRNQVTNFTNQILTAVWDIIARPEMNDISLSFTSPIQSAVEDFKKNQSNANNNNAVRSDQVQPGGKGLPGN